MELLSAIGGCLFGMWITHQWGNHRAKYYRGKMREAINLASMTQESNKMIHDEMSRVKTKSRVRSIGSMKDGLNKALADLSKERM